MHDWDHADFVGQDSNDTKRSQAELRQFYEGIASDLVKLKTLKHRSSDANTFYEGEGK